MRRRSFLRRPRVFLNYIVLGIGAFAIRMVSFWVLPKKYFLDSRKILGMLLYDRSYDSAYNFVASIYRKLNFFKLTSLEEWALIVALVMIPLILIWWYRCRIHGRIQEFFLITTMAFSSIYTFGLTKDLIQFVIFLAIAMILHAKRLSERQKVWLTAGVLLIESFCFRKYFLLITLMFVAIWKIHRIVTGRWQKSIFNYSMFIVCIFGVLLGGILVVSLVDKKSFYDIALARHLANDYRMGSTDAQTMILEPFGISSNMAKFSLNYLVNFARLSLPIELVWHGVKYWFALIYILLLNIRLWHVELRMGGHAVLVGHLVLAFVMVSAIFEPDFGSWLRHCVALAPVSFLLFGVKEKKEKYERFNICNCSNLQCRGLSGAVSNQYFRAELRQIRSDSD